MKILKHEVKTLKLTKPVKKQKKKVKKTSFKLGNIIIPLHTRLGFKSRKWRALQKACEERSGGKKCVVSDGHCYGALHLHHKKPLSEGGTNRLNNLEWRCYAHHAVLHVHMVVALLKGTEKLRREIKKLRRKRT